MKPFADPVPQFGEKVHESITLLDSLIRNRQEDMPATSVLPSEFRKRLVNLERDVAKLKTRSIAYPSNFAFEYRGAIRFWNTP